jgi:nicotinate-nucleotide pyrophosphorylase (carboxylating)
MTEPLPREVVRHAVERALDEDLGAGGDVTTDAIVAEDARAVARIVARQRLVVAGLAVAEAVFRRLDPWLTVTAQCAEGEPVDAGAVLLVVSGAARPILMGERTALNFLMRMCGIATAARAAVDEVAGTGAAVLDTRKTAPGLRRLDKYAAAVGGAVNHRMGLYDAVMIKDTHLGVAGSLEAAVTRARERSHPPSTITAEVRTVQELEEAIRAGAGRALLDNMDLETLRRCVEVGKGRIVLEASGGLRPGKLREVAATGVDCLSIGWLTHSVTAADVAMEMGEAVS